MLEIIYSIILKKVSLSTKIVKHCSTAISLRSLKITDFGAMIMESEVSHVLKMHLNPEARPHQEY